MINSPTMERVVLDYHNGRPSVLLSESADGPILHWLIFGYTESFDLWLHLRVPPGVAAEIVNRPPVLLDGVLPLAEGRWARFGLYDGDRPLVLGDWHVPPAATLAQGLQTFAGSVAAAIAKAQKNEADPADVKPLSAAEDELTQLLAS